MKVSEELYQKILKTLGNEIAEAISKLQYENGDYLDIAVANPTKISYIPKNAIKKYEALNLSGRGDFREQKGLFVKISKLLSLCGLNNSDVSKMVVKYSTRDAVVSYQSGTASEIYGYCNNNQTLYGCMNIHATSLDRFYGNFNLQALLFKVDESVIGRALLWLDVDFGSSGVFHLLDRVYTNVNETGDNYSNSNHNQEYLSLILNFAKQNGWATKEYQSYDEKRDFVLPNGESWSGELKVTSKYYFDRDAFFPYVDTFTYSNDLQTFTNDNDSTYKCTNTYGDIDDGYEYHCDCCGDGIEEDEEICIDNYYYCSRRCAEKSGFEFVTFRAANGVHYKDWRDKESENTVYVDRLDVYADKEDVHYCDICDEYHFTSTENVCVIYQNDNRNTYYTLQQDVCDICLDTFTFAEFAYINSGIEKDVYYQIDGINKAKILVVDGEAYENVAMFENIENSIFLVSNQESCNNLSVQASEEAAA